MLTPAEELGRSLRPVIRLSDLQHLPAELDHERREELVPVALVIVAFAAHQAEPMLAQNGKQPLEFASLWAPAADTCRRAKASADRRFR